MKFPNKSQFSKLSESARRVNHSLEWSEAIGEVDDVCASERYDFVSDLNSILLGKLPRFLVKRHEHLRVLSMETILESQLVDDGVVKKILSESNKEWIRTKPLQVIAGNLPGRQFVDKPPRRILQTNASLEHCQTHFKGKICEYLSDFCHFLDSDELLNFFMDDILDNVVKKRFEQFRHQLSKNVEKWCEELKRLEFSKVVPLKSTRRPDEVANCPRFGKKHSYNLNIEQELEEILRSQFAELEGSHQASKRRKVCAEENLNLEEVLSAQMMDGSGDGRIRPSKKTSSMQMDLEKEFDMFTEELANICSQGESHKVVDDLYSPIHHIDDATFDDGEQMEEGIKSPNKGKENSSDVNENLVCDGVIQKSKAISRSLRKKTLDKEDQHESLQKRHKRKKEDKKHKLKKRKKNKHKDVEAKERNVSLKVEEGELESQFNNGSKGYEKKSSAMKSFQPNEKFYVDSYLSSGHDVYQSQKGLDHLDANFEPEFDPTLPPGPSQESPLMHIMMDSSGAMEQLMGIIPDTKQFCTDLVSSKNAFLWALSLSTLDLSVCRADDDAKKQSLKSTSNPLMQAFRRAVEASKKKEDVRVTKSSKKSKHVIQQKPVFKSSGLTSLFKLNTNLKSASKEVIKEALSSFQGELDNYSKEENFFESHQPIEVDFSGAPAHFDKVSDAMDSLYLGAEEKFSARERPRMMHFHPMYVVNGTATSAGELLPSTQEGTAGYQVATSIMSGVILASNVDPTANAGVSSSNVSQSTPSNATSAGISKPNFSNSSIYTAASASVATPTLGYSSYAYNPYSAMYPQVTWAYQTSYIPGYMPDLTSMQAYQGLTLQYPMMASATIAPANLDMIQTLQQPASATPDENSSEGAVSAQAFLTDETTPSKTVTNKKSSGRPPKNTRTCIFKNETSVSKEVERYLDNIGLKKFDLYNLGLLRHLPNFECLIFIHEDDSKLVNQIPGLLRLKRDLRVVFVVYNSLEAVMNKQYSMIFPRAGMVLMDESALIACKSDVLDGLCQFMRKQTYEKGTAWKLLITSSTFKILDQLMYQLEDDIEEHVRITEVSQILQTYKTTGIVEVLSDEFYMSDPKSTADYHACFLALQKARHGSCRHFLFVTDMARNCPDAKMFLTNGIDIMSVVEFMRCFVSKTVVHSPKTFESYITRNVPEKYLDAPTSDCAQTISF